MIVIRGGEVLTSDGWARADLSIERGVVSTIGTGLSGDIELDASGCLVGPGFVDMHTHLREPGQSWKEDIASAGLAAAAGGFTAVTAMPNTQPPMDTAKVIESVIARGEEVGLVELVAASALTKDRSGAELVDLEDLYAGGVRVFTDDGDALVDPALMRAALEIIAGLPGALVAQHAEDPAMTVGGHMHEGQVSRELGVGGLPAEAETSIVDRDLELVASTGARYHCQHVSAKMTVESIRRAKEAGSVVTAEVTPHHLNFDENDVRERGTNFKMYPPLRSAEDREALVAAIADGTIDVVATDHAPHSDEEKSIAFDLAPRGVIGLETAAAATWEALGDRDRLFDVLSTRPAAILGLRTQGQRLVPGSVANLVVFDPSEKWVPASFKSKSANSPYRGREMTGKVVATVHQGRVTHHSGSRP